MKPQPKPANGQHWRDTKHNVVRRITDDADPWKVEMENVVTGKRTKVFRVAEWGRPERYEYVPKSPELGAREVATLDEVHIRFQPGEGQRLAYCMKPVDDLVTTTLDNLPFWRKRRPICKECDRRRQDGKGVLGEIAGAV